MIRIKYGPNPQGIKEVEIQPQLVGGLTKKSKENKKRSELKKNNLKKKEEIPKVVPTPPKKEKGVKTKRRSSTIHHHATKDKQNGVDSQKGATTRAHSPGHGHSFIK
jgi:hypothetical protein